jgi:hypothetical protein
MRNTSAYPERIQRVVDYLHDHLDEKFDLEKLAAPAHLSLYHFHLTYRGLLGETVYDTIRSAFASVARRSTSSIPGSALSGRLRAPATRVRRRSRARVSSRVRQAAGPVSRLAGGSGREFLNDPRQVSAKDLETAVMMPFEAPAQ